MNSVDTRLRWPETTADVERRRAYDTFLKLFLGRHQEVFDPYRRPDEGPYVTTNILGAITRLIAHRLFGEAPTATAVPSSESRVASRDGKIKAVDPEPETRNPEQALLGFLCASNGWQQLCYQGALGASYRGEAVLKVRYDAARDAVVMEEVPPGCFFPVLAEDQQEEVEAVSLAWVISGRGDPMGRPSPANGNGLGRPIGPPLQEEADAAHVAWLREEYHTPGLIENRLWKLIRVPGEDRYLRQPARLTDFEATAELEPLVATGLDVIPIVHVPNRKVAETGLWGRSDYAELVSLQEALNRRKTQTGNILDKHADPLLAIDESFLDDQRRLPMDRIRAIPLVQDQAPPQYITWDGKLSDGRAEADDLVHKILLVAGISPESFGFGVGGLPESGRAIALRQVMTTSTIAGKRLLWEPALRKLLSIATKMHVAHVRSPRVGRASLPVDVGLEARPTRRRVRALEPEGIRIEFGDGLPREFAEAIEDEVKLQGAGLASKEASLRRLFPGWSAVEVASEAARIAADQG